jgi:hypothetical protein
MNTKLRTVEKTAANESLVSETSSREAAMVAERADCRVLQQPDPSGRKLRKHIIMANVVAWIVIIGLIRLIFF